MNLAKEIKIGNLFCCFSVIELAPFVYLLVSREINPGGKVR